MDASPSDSAVAWKSFVAKNRIVPPAFDRQKKLKDSASPYCIGLKSLEGLPLSAKSSGGHYQLKIHLFDVTYKRFFGKSWHGPLQSAQNSGGKGQVGYNQNVYLYTSSGDSSVVAVLEVVRLSSGAARNNFETVGWGILRLFSTDSEHIPDVSNSRNSPTKRIDLYHGSPRALYQMEDPIEKNGLLRVVSGCVISYQLQTHYALLKIGHLVPENFIIGGLDIVPGMAGLAKGDRLRKPKPLGTFTAYLEGVTVSLLPNFDKFEEELCRLLDQDRLNRDNRIAEGQSVSVQERRLSIGVHNGFGYVDKPYTLQLVPADLMLRRGSSMRKNHGSTLSVESTGNLGGALVLRERVPLMGVMDDPLAALVFRLEYTILEPVDTETRKAAMSISRSQTYSVTLRWCAWSPFPGPHTKVHKVSVPLVAGPSPTTPSPDEVLVYKALSAAAGMELQNGNISFNYVEDRGSNQFGSDEGGLAGIAYGDMGGAPFGHPSMSQQMFDSYEEGIVQSVSPGKPPRHQNGSRSGVGGGSPFSSHQFLQPPPSPGVFHDQGGRGLGGSGEISRGHMQPSITPHKSTPLLTPSRGVLSAVISAPELGHHGAEHAAIGHDIRRSADPRMGNVPVGYGRQEAEDNLQHREEGEEMETPIYPSHVPIIRQTNSLQTGLSRAAYARLYSIKFPPIEDRHKEAPEVVDPQQPLSFNVQKEEMDVLQCNELVFQFLAFSREYAMMPMGPIPQHATVFFTFQFYRYPQITTERMLLSTPVKGLSSGDTTQPCILHKLNGDGTLSSVPGFTTRYMIDPTEMNPGEAKLFVQHLVQQKLHIDVWDGDSLLCIGSASVSLKDMCRQGREAVQMTCELPIYKMESMIGGNSGVGGASGGPAGPNGQLPPRGVLHLRLANIGHPVEQKALKNSYNRTKGSSSLLIASAKSSQGSFFGGSLTTGLSQAVKESRSSRALHMTNVDRELAAALTSAPHLPPAELSEEGVDEARKRKLARMQAIRAGEDEENVTPKKTYLTYKTEKQSRAKDLKIIEVYREKTKRDGILNILHKSITVEHTISPSMGSSEFFECPLKNPHNHLIEVSIVISDPELSVITNATEWRHFKRLKMVQTPCEEDMFTVDAKGNPRITMQPKESVNIPFKFHTLKADHSVIPQEPVSDKATRLGVDEAARSLSESLSTRVIGVSFKVCDTDQLISIMSVHVHPQPHTVSETYRFTHPEHSFFSQSFRLPSNISLPNHPVGGPQKGKIMVACSDPNVILNVDSIASSGEPHTLRLKTAVGASPEVKRFFVCVYQDTFLSQPLEIWQFYFHSLQRVDISAPEGEATNFTLIVKGTKATRYVQCFTSHPSEMTLTPGDCFLLAANAVHELSVRVKSSEVGRRYMYVNVVDVDYHQLVRTWMICYDCQRADVRKTIKVKVPIEGGPGSNKRVTYTNPYRTAKAFFISTNLPNSVLVKTDRLELGPNQSGVIMFTVLPHAAATSMQTGALLYINDENDHNQETLGILVSFTADPLN